jgi:general stress protein 26
MRTKDNIDRVWDIIEKISVCMLTTQFVGGLRARPLEARPDRYARHIYFVTDIHSAKEDEIEPRPMSALPLSIRTTRPTCRSPAALASCARLTR